MARRRQNGTADDFIELVALMPWWAGIALAIISYVILHSLAATPAVVATRPDQVGQMVTSTIWRTFAYAGQFLVPFLCLLGALVSVLRRHKRKALLEGVTSSDAASSLEGMSWREFELLVGEGYRQQGYRVVETGGGGDDGGVDLRLQKNGEKFLVQCKQWKAFKVGVQTVRELFGVMAAEGATGGMIVTSGTFTSEAQAFAKGRNLELVDGPALMALLRRARGPSQRSEPRARHDAQPVTVTVPPSAPTAVECPRCGAEMVRRVARRGANAGASFWGCTRYPGCTGTLG
jgi:restriction system protein